ncbi:MAG: HD domain-containing protein [Oscillospiraceae bacterium]|nr:HD domain-containing protein [Oscillospiraceae bacterium]
MFLEFPDFVVSMMRKLHAQGFEAYLVGGCVRDAVLGTIPHDYDIATNAVPEQIIELFGRENCSEYGRAFGTVCVHDPDYSANPDHKAEITTYRTESDYRDFRHPCEVRFATHIEEDLCRRDFTCNAMAWNPDTGLLDLYQGQQDLADGILRCVGVPSARFREDALRILRAMRFCAKLNLKPEIFTHSAMLAGAFRLQYISVERIFAELCNMLLGENITEILLTYPEILSVWIPEILPCIAFCQHSRYHDYTVWEHTARAVGNAPADLTIRLTMLFHDLAKPACCKIDRNGGHFKGHAERGAVLADQILTRVKADNHTRKQVSRLIRYHRRTPESLREVRKILSEIGYPDFVVLLKILEADRVSKLKHQSDNGEKIRQAEKFMQICQEQKLCCSLKELAMNGHDLSDLGFQGKEIKFMLQKALNAVISGTCENTKPELLQFLLA